MVKRKKFDVVNALRRLPVIPAEFFRSKILARFMPIMPTSFIYNVTFRCNARCIMCDNWKRKSENDLTVDELHEAFGSKLFSRIKNIGITGGEPFLRDDLPELIRACGDKMPRLHKLTISTNGFLKDRTLRLAEEILQYAEQRKILIGIRISMDGFEETHDRVRGVPGAYVKAMDTFAGLQELSKRYFFNIGLAHTLLPENIRETELLYDWCQERNIDVVLNVPRFTGSMMDNIHLEESQSLDEGGKEIMVRLFRRLVRENSLFNGAIFLYHHYAKMAERGSLRSMPCPFQHEGLQLNPNGDLYYCERSHQIGNLREGDPLQRYKDADNLRKRRKLHKKVCPGCLNPCMASVGAAQQVFPYSRFFLEILWRRLFHPEDRRKAVPAGS